jgi:hypothetical protein
MSARTKHSSISWRACNFAMPLMASASNSGACCSGIFFMGSPAVAGGVVEDAACHGSGARPIPSISSPGGLHRLALPASFAAGRVFLREVDAAHARMVPSAAQSIHHNSTAGLP